jgi:hypothetical protein
MGHKGEESLLKTGLSATLLNREILFLMVQNEKRRLKTPLKIQGIMKGKV